MSFGEFLSFCKENKIRLKQKNGNIIVEADAHLVNEHFRDSLRKYKEQLITHIQESNKPDKMALEKFGFPLSSSQQQLFFFSTKYNNNKSYNIPAAFKIYGDLKVEALSKSFNSLLLHHELLRANFIVIDGKPAQKTSGNQSINLECVDFSTEINIDEKYNKHFSKINRPFDLKKDTLFRVSLIKIHEKEYILIIVIHHIIVDGWSLNILLKDLNRIYTEGTRTENFLLPSPKKQFVDYVFWEKEYVYLNKRKLLAYWSDKLRNIPELHALPLDFPRPKKQSHLGSTIIHNLSEKLSENIINYCRNQRVTLFSGLYAAFVIFINRLSNTSDIVIGTPIANRSHNEFSDVVGMFADTLPLRVKIQNDISFQQFLLKCNETLLKAQNNRLSFDSIINELGVERSLSYSPICQVMLSLSNTVENKLELPNVTINPIKGSKSESKFDLTLDIEIKDGRLITNWEYSTAIFHEDSVKRWALQFENLLENIPYNTNNPIKQLKLNTKKDIDSLEKFHTLQNEKKFEDYNVVKAFNEITNKFSDKIALIHKDVKLTYRELMEKARILMNSILDHSSSPKLVAIYLDKSIDCYLSILAVLKSGAAYLTLDCNNPDIRIEKILELADPDLIITNKKYLEKFTNRNCFDIGKQEKISLDREIKQNLSGNEAAYCCFTSGSTGIPKGALIPHKGIVRLIKNQSYVSLSNKTIIAQLSNLSFDAATFEIWGAWLNGGTLVIPEDNLLNTKKINIELEKHQVNTIFLTSAYFDLWSKEKNKKLHLREIIVGGDVVNPYSVKRVYEELPNVTIINGYGPTENTTFSCCYRIPRFFNTEKPIPIGFPIKETGIAIVSENKEITPLGGIGELWVRGAGVSLGYINNKAESKEKFITHKFNNWPKDQYYRTGDLVRISSEGKIEYLGRRDSEVKLRGFRIDLAEIEACISRYEDVDAVATIMQQNKTGDKFLVSFVSSKSNKKEDIGELIKIHVAKFLPEYMVPSRIYIVDDFPMTDSGKIDKRKLRLPKNLSSDRSKENSSIEDRVTIIWSEILDLPEKFITRSSSFFKLGGTSLMSMRLIARINEVFNTQLDISDIFNSPTLNSFSGLIDQNYNSSKVALKSHPEIKLAPLSFSQKRLWLIQTLDPDANHYNMIFGLKLKGSLCISSLEQSISEIIQRHEILRTKYKINSDGEIFQSTTEKYSFKLITKNLTSCDNRIKENERYKATEKLKNHKFDLKNDLMLRAELIKYSEKEYDLYFILHHIAFDAHSTSIFINELSHHYSRKVNNFSIADLDPVDFQYRDFAIWENKNIGLEETGIQYWKNQLKDIPTIHSIPTDFKRPVKLSHSGSRIKKRIQESLKKKVDVFIKENDISIFMLMHTILSALIARYSNELDVIVGSPINIRNSNKLLNTIGFFSNTIILRSKIQKNISFLDLIYKNKKTILEAYKHQYLPFEKIVDLLNPERSMSHNPIFQIMLSMHEDTENGSIKMDDIEVSPNPVLNESSQFDLCIDVKSNSNSLTLEWEYSSDLFARNSVEQMATHFVQLLELCLREPNTSIFNCQIITSKELEREFILQ
ncbi:amino acid adenylation domain-containing protein [Microbulbifer sp. CnH-101-G]|uniref:amino acid adenylation domain-containing protein n=1 Tax=Microbulbifer sp. CnH-101-G TaxID=3243393 RepID=UPI004039C685